MNIFASHPSPLHSALVLDDKRVVKMVLESAQMLSTAISQRGCCAPYRENHVNHPCSVWVRSTQGNYFWLLQHWH